MTQNEWDALVPGDIVIERRSKTPRLVLAVHRRPWKAKHPVTRTRSFLMIEVMKIRRSQYPCPTTDLCPSDWRARLDVAYGRHGRVRREFFYCECHGWSHVVRGPIWVDPVYKAAHPRETRLQADHDRDPPRPTREDWERHLSPAVRE